MAPSQISFNLAKMSQNILQCPTPWPRHTFGCDFGSNVCRSCGQSSTLWHVSTIPFVPTHYQNSHILHLLLLSCDVWPIKPYKIYISPSHPLLVNLRLMSVVKCLDCSERILNKTRPHRGGVLHNGGLKWSNQIFARTQVVWVIGGFFWTSCLAANSFMIHSCKYMNTHIHLFLDSSGRWLSSDTAKLEKKDRIRSKFHPDHASAFPFFLKDLQKSASNFLAWPSCANSHNCCPTFHLTS